MKNKLKKGIVVLTVAALLITGSGCGKKQEVKGPVEMSDISFPI